MAVTVMRGTTPTLQLIVEGADLTDWSVYVTFDWGAGELTKRNDDIRMESTDTGTVLFVHMTQAETLQFSDRRSVAVQVRAIKAGEAVATCDGQFSVGRILLEGEINE